MRSQLAGPTFGGAALLARRPPGRTYGGSLTARPPSSPDGSSTARNPSRVGRTQVPRLQRLRWSEGLTRIRTLLGAAGVQEPLAKSGSGASFADMADEDFPQTRRDSSRNVLRHWAVVVGLSRRPGKSPSETIASGPKLSLCGNNPRKSPAGH
jgi:hypothetical protein